MSYSAYLQDVDKTPEKFDDEKAIDNKVKKLARLINKSTFCCVYTGAGMSTSAGIPDYRSGADTKSPSGIGYWSRRVRAKLDGEEVRCYDNAEDDAIIVVAKPAPGHLDITALYQRDFVHHIITQNVDDLHRKSGFPSEQISELHGNITEAVCHKCEKHYYFPNERVRTAVGENAHRISNKRCHADECTKPLLYDTIVNFGDPLDSVIFDRAEAASKKCDLLLILGSSLIVYPAMDLVENAHKNGAKVVIVNLQETWFDSKAHLVINAYIDVVLQKLRKELSID